jgi:hypothetical protein
MATDIPQAHPDAGGIYEADEGCSELEEFDEFTDLDATVAEYASIEKSGFNELHEANCVEVEGQHDHDLVSMSVSTRCCIQEQVAAMCLETRRCEEAFRSANIDAHLSTMVSGHGGPCRAERILPFAEGAEFQMFGERVGLDQVDVPAKRYAWTRMGISEADKVGAHGRIGAPPVAGTPVDCGAFRRLQAIGLDPARLVSTGWIEQLDEVEVS